jgi:hypothetical protein
VNHKLRARRQVREKQKGYGLGKIEIGIFLLVQVAEGPQDDYNSLYTPLSTVSEQKRGDEIFRKYQSEVPL